jgi:hypothetical protein
MSKKKERDEAWFRVVVFIVSGVITYVWSYLSFVLIFVNWLLTLITGKRNAELADFIEYWSTQLYRFWRYMSGINNERPFPFGKLDRMSFFKK